MYECVHIALAPGNKLSPESSFQRRQYKHRVRSEQAMLLAHMSKELERLNAGGALAYLTQKAAEPNKRGVQQLLGEPAFREVR